MSVSKIQIFVDYIPAEVKDGKICRIVYYAKNPSSQKLERLVVKCNRLGSKKANYKLALKIADEINKKLHEGYNPFMEKISSAGYKTFSDALPLFWQNKKRNLRPDSLRCYKSYLQFFEKFLRDAKLYNSFIFSFGKNSSLSEFCNRN